MFPANINISDHFIEQDFNTVVELPQLKRETSNMFYSEIEFLKYISVSCCDNSIFYMCVCVGVW